MLNAILCLYIFALVHSQIPTTTIITVYYIFNIYMLINRSRLLLLKSPCVTPVRWRCHIVITCKSRPIVHYSIKIINEGAYTDHCRLNCYFCIYYFHCVAYMFYQKCMIKKTRWNKCKRTRHRCTKKQTIVAKWENEYSRAMRKT